MQSLLIRSLLSGDVFAVDYTDTVPSVQTIRAQLHEQGVGTQRNTIIHLYRMEAVEAAVEAAAAASTASLQGDAKEDTTEDTPPMRLLSDQDTVAASDELVMVCEVERRMTSKEIAVVEDGIMHKLCAPESDDTIFHRFREALVAAGAVVAGGSIVAAFASFDIHDLDIYVNFSKASAFLRAMNDLGFENKYTDAIQMASEYDQSFFRKNHILVRFPMQKMTYNAQRTVGVSVHIDVMVIPDNVSVETVVTNFDLSFCEVWWDGRAVYAADPYGLRHKEGVLKPDYRRALFTEFNHFILKRLRKYTGRGFAIDTCAREYFLETMETSALVKSAPSSIFPNRRAQRKQKRVNDFESWVCKRVLQQIYFNLSQFVNWTTLAVAEGGVRPVQNRLDYHRELLSYRSRIHLLYFMLSDGTSTARRSTLDAALGKEFIDLFAAYVYLTEFNEYIPKTYHAAYKKIFPSCVELSSCHVLRFAVFDLSDHLFRIFDLLHHARYQASSEFMTTHKGVMNDAFRRAKAIQYLGLCRPDDHRNHFHVEYVPRLIRRYIHPADDATACMCEDCTYIRQQLTGYISCPGAIAYALQDDDSEEDQDESDDE